MVRFCRIVQCILCTLGFCNNNISHVCLQSILSLAHKNASSPFNSSKFKIEATAILRSAFRLTQQMKKTCFDLFPDQKNYQIWILYMLMLINCSTKLVHCATTGVILRHVALSVVYMPNIRLTMGHFTANCTTQNTLPSHIENTLPIYILLYKIQQNCSMVLCEISLEKWSTEL